MSKLLYVFRNLRAQLRQHMINKFDYFTIYNILWIFIAVNTDYA